MGNQSNDRKRGMLQAAARLAWGGQWAWKLAERSGTDEGTIRAMSDGVIPVTLEVMEQIDLELLQMAGRIARHRANLASAPIDG